MRPEAIVCLVFACLSGEFVIRCITVVSLICITTGPKRGVNMTILVAVRLPEELNDRLEERAVIQGISKSKVMIEILQGAFQPDVVEDDAPIVAPTPAARPLLPYETLESEEEVPMCTYTEYVSEEGETYRCGLRRHSNKVRHTRGDKL
jgi:hypothetical protein